MRREHNLIPEEAEWKKIILPYAYEEEVFHEV